MRNKAILTAIGATLCAGCYHVSVVTGAPPSPTKIDMPWQSSLVFGLVPPSELNTKTQCPQSVAKVEAEHSFLNMLVAGITQSIYTPIHVSVTCAAGPVGR